MPAAAELLTPRLRLRQFRPSDEPALADINADPEVTRYLNRPIGRAASRAFYENAVAHWATHGFGFWAAESREPETSGRFLGFIGLGYATLLPQLAHRLPRRAGLPERTHHLLAGLLGRFRRVENLLAGAAPVREQVERPQARLDQARRALDVALDGRVQRGSPESVADVAHARLE